MLERSARAGAWTNEPIRRSAAGTPVTTSARLTVGLAGWALTLDVESDELDQKRVAAGRFVRLCAGAGVLAMAAKLHL